MESITDLVVDSLTEDQQIDLNQLLSTITEPLTELNTTAAHALSDLIIGDIDASNVLMMDACDVIGTRKYVFYRRMVGSRRSRRYIDNDQHLPRLFERFTNMDSVKVLLWNDCD